MTKCICLQHLLLLLLLRVAYGYLCGNNVSSRKINLTEKMLLTPSPPSPTGPSIEYLYDVAEPTKSVIVKCWPVDNSNRNAKDYPKVIVETQVNGKTDVSDLSCKGGSSTRNISSMGKVRVGLCSGNVKEWLYLSAQPETDCKVDLRVATEEKTFTLSKSNERCAVRLTSLQGGIEATISAIKTKTTTSSRCKAAYIAATGIDEKNIERPILLDNKSKICKTTNGSLKSEYTIKAESPNAEIKFRNTAFELKFKTLQPIGGKNIDTDSVDKDKISVSKEIKTTSINANTLTNASTTSNVNVLADDVPNGSSSNTPYIIALGCGGLLIIIVIIVALVLVKKRNARSTPGKSKDGHFTRQNSTKYSHDTPAVNTGVTRNPSIGSINNAMYDRVLSGQDTSEKSGNKKNKRENLANNKNFTDSKRKRLAELEEQYGPFLETAEYHQNAFKMPESCGIFRRETRPMLSPPQEATCRVTSIRERTPASPNLYESIAEMQPAPRPAPQYDQTRASYITFTSDEFSDCEEVSYDPTSRDSKYPLVVSYDTVDDASESNAPSVKYNNINESKQLPKVKVHQAQDAIDSHRPNLSSFASGPSLPELTTNGYLDLNSQRSCSIASSLQEDNQHYLQPRPSCPDAVVACAYSSTEDLQQMRQRLLAVAHPCLLQNKDNTTSLVEIPSKNMYDSPRQSAEEIRSSTELDKVAYATPRRPEQRP